MPIFMDVHDDLKLDDATIDMITTLTKDGVTDEFGVRQLELYHNAAGQVYCLLDAPDADAVRLHHEVGGIVCHDVHQVSGML